MDTTFGRHLGRVVRIEQGPGRPAVAPVSSWRIAAGIAVLAGMAGVLAFLTPVYFHDWEFQRFVAGITHYSAAKDGELRGVILQRAHSLGLPVTEDDVHIARSSGILRIDVRYMAPVNLPGYEVNLHFHPAAASR